MTQLYNHLEVFIWTILGVFCFAIGCTKPRRERKLFFIAAIDLIIFGISDYFEAKTGNVWWRPWWLLLWKASCIAVMLGIFTIVLRQRRLSRALDQPTPEPSAPQSREERHL